MKVQNLNSSSRKTRRLIKTHFAQMLSEKKELEKITVSELCRRAEISRGAFYSHYDDIYGVAEDYENELIDAFFDSARLCQMHDIPSFIDVFFAFVSQNHEDYTRICRSHDFIFAVEKLTGIATDKLRELCLADSRFCNQANLTLELRIFLEGLMCEYVKYCRGYSDITLDDLYNYTHQWVGAFLLLHGCQEPG